MKNKLRRGTTSPQIADNMKTAPGVFGKSPHPPFDKYPETVSPQTGPTRFAETGVLGAKESVNNLRQARSRDNQIAKTVAKVSSSNTNTKPNKYRSGRTMKNMREKL